MELRVNELAIPERIDWNYEELKAGLIKATEDYKGLVYTDANIKDAKKDVASLRKLKDALNSERIRLQKEYLAPFNAFKAQVDELIALVDEPVKAIDAQVREYTNQKIKEKAEAIEALITEKAFPKGFNIGPVRNPKWMNASYSLKKISEELDAAKDKILEDINTIDNIPEYSFEAMDVYKRTLDLRLAVSETQRLHIMAERKKAHEEERLRQETTDFPPAPVEYNIEEPVEAPASEWVTFSVYVTVDEAKALAAWLRERGISIRA